MVDGGDSHRKNNNVNIAFFKEVVWSCWSVQNY